MKIVIIEGDETEPQVAVKIPLSGLKFVNALILQKAKDQMAANGIDLEGILKEIETDLHSAAEPMTLLDVQEDGEHIIISLE